MTMKDRPLINRREQQSRLNTRQVHIRVSGSVFDAFDRYAQKVAKERNRTAVSRSITFERLVFDARRHGLLD